MSRCWALALRYGKFVVELLWACPLVVLYNMSLAGVRVVEFGPYSFFGGGNKLQLVTGPVISGGIVSYE